nr:putative integron gene cassette protein [uncultured bacterium]
MSSLPQGMVVLLLVAIVMAVVMHWRTRNFWLASAVSGVATFAAFYVICFFQAGPPEPTGIKAFALFAGFGLIVAVVTGLVAKVLRPALSRRA